MNHDCGNKINLGFTIYGLCLGIASDNKSIKASRLLIHKVLNLGNNLRHAKLPLGGTYEFILFVIHGLQIILFRG